MMHALAYIYSGYCLIAEESLAGIWPKTAFIRTSAKVIFAIA